MFNFPKNIPAISAAAFGLMLALPAYASEDLGLGRAATADEIAGWNIDVRPDGVGLPPGQGTVEDGEAIYVERCSHCHGEFGYGGGSRYPQLAGGEGTLTSEDPRKTIGSYWPYASTLYDYIKRAMPFGEAQTLTDNEVYSVTAFLLNINDIVDDDVLMNAETLAGVVMPNVGGFIDDDRPDVANTACMENCKDDVTIISFAKKVGVTPDLEQEQ